MIPVQSRAEARAFDAAAVAAGVPSLLLMENAGRGVVEAMRRRWPVGPHRVVVVAGPGNNGGDGFVVARHLHLAGDSVDVFVVADEASFRGDARTQLDAMRGVGLSTRPAVADLSELAAAMTSATHVVDALFGTGLARPLDGAHAAVVDAVNNAKKPVVAVDLPSGLDADTGAVLGKAVSAALTVTFGAHKRGLLTPRGADLSGAVVVAHIGVRPPDVERAGARLVERRDVASLLSRRSPSSYKTSAGHVVVFAGSPGHIGAAVMCAHGALRAGAGLVTVATWPDAADGLDTRVVEVMTARLARDSVASSVDAALTRATAVVVGPGFGKSDESRAAVEHILSHWDGPLVMDADALALYGGRAGELATARSRLVLTPHPGELGVLLGTSAKAVEADRFAALASAIDATHAVALLKGAPTLVGAPGAAPVVNASGGPYLGTAGAGDVLSGTIGALACSLPPHDAAIAGVYLHGLAGDAWSRAHGDADRGMLAHEIADQYLRLFAELTR